MQKKISVITIATLFGILLFAATVVHADTISDTYNNSIYPKAAYNTGINPPFSINNAEDESISPVTGGIQIKKTDINLKGKNGLDIVLARYYDSSQANLSEADVTTYESSYTYTAYYVVSVEIVKTIYTTNGAVVSTSSECWPDIIFDTQEQVDEFHNELCEKYSYLEDNSDGTVSYYEAYMTTTPQTETGYHPHYTNSISSDKTTNEKYSYLGAGWAFDLPYIEVKGSDKYFHDGSEGCWKIDFNSVNSHLSDYPLKDMILNNDSGTYTNGQMSSSYVLEEKDGRKTYFGSDGRLLGIKDRFGNEIKFQHDTTANGYPLINKIIDSAGREINIAYSSTKVTLTVNDLTNSANNRTITYNKVPTTVDTNKYVLDSVIDEGNRETKYEYNYSTASYNFLNKAVGGVSVYVANISKIKYPTNSERDYTYLKAVKNLGNEGVMEFYKVSERYDSKNDGVKYNYKKYNYIYNGSNEYDGYPAYYNDQSIPSNFSIQTNVQDSDNNSEIYTFNNKLLCTDILKEGSDHKNEIINEYDLTKKLLTKTVKREYNKATGQFMETAENYGYDANDYKDLVGYWDSQNQRDTNNLPINDEHKTTYTYDSTYHYITSKIYKKDSATTIKEEYTPGPDEKTIQWAKTYENNNIKKQTWYAYDTYGNVIEERDYLDDWVTYIPTKFSYDDNNPAVRTQFNGLYQTRKWTDGVIDPDDNLVAPKTGNSAGTIDSISKYDWFGNLIEKQDGMGCSTTYQYDKLGRVLKETNADGSYKSYSYNDSSNIVTSTEENLKHSETGYDGFGNIIYQKDITSGQTLNQYTYDNNFRIKTESNNGNANTTTYYYNSDGRANKKEIKDSSGKVIYTETYTYDDANNNGQYYEISKTILGDTNSPSITTNIYINKFGQTEKQESIHSSNYMYTYKYDYLGNKIEEKSAMANDENWNQPYTSKYEYNYAGKVTKTYNVNGDYSTIEYDALGRVKTETDIKGNKANPIYSTTYSYDNLGRVLEEKRPFESINGTVYYSDKKHYYDLNGNIILEKVAQNKSGETIAYTQTKNEYNNRNMLVKVITYDKEVPANFTQYYYDGVGNKIRMYTGLSSPLIINGLDNVTTTGDTDYSVTKYEYNQFNKLAKMTDALGNSETYNYDYNGNLVQHIDRNGNIIVMTYDGLNNILSKAVTTPDGSGNSSNIYTYTITGKMASMSCGENSTTYVYDDLGRLITEAESNGITKDYSYDAGNNKKSLVIKQNGAVKENTTYTYDNMNRLYQVLENGQLSATYSYDANGNRESLEYTNGNSTEYQYNLGNKLIQLTNKKGTSTISQYDYTYYLDGKQASKNDLTAGLTSYTYDGLGRLSSVSEPGSVVTTYQYDDSNNRTAMTISSGANAGTTTYEYDKNNRLLKEMKAAGENETDITRYGYDANGNQTYKENETLKPAVTGDTESLNMYIVGQDASDDASIYQYDGFNQLIKSIVGDKTVTYEYDGNGLRTSKTVNGAATTQVWDGGQIALELNGAGAVTNKYVRGSNLIYGEDGTGSNKKFYLFNGHGDAVQLTDTTGNVIKSYDYDSFGNEKSIDPNDTNPFRYCGGEYYWDNETGDYYIKDRYYDPEIGRFTSEDSVWSNQDTLVNGVKVDDALSLNLYTYCQNDPIDGYDPSGHGLIDIGFTIIDAGNLITNPSWGNVGWLVLDVACFFDPTDISDTAIHVGRAVKTTVKVVGITKDVEKGMDVVKFVKDGGRLINDYKDLTKVLKGTGLEAHHLIEKRFANVLGVKASKMLSVALTHEQHQIYTNLWRKYIPYGTKYEELSRKEILDVAKKVYKDAPELLKVIENVYK